MNCRMSAKQIGTKMGTAFAVAAGATLLTVALTYRGAEAANGNGAGPAGRTPVIVELFTSEGCSSCPSADAVLAQLKREQPVKGVFIIALGEHVDYWNRLGWTDPFSSHAFSERQADYMRALKLDEVYTPQAVVNGHEEFVGSDLNRAEGAVARAARAPYVNVKIERKSSARLHVEVDPLSTVQPRGATNVLLAITEDNLRSSVVRGENSGRTLQHVSVVRRLTRLGSGSLRSAFIADVPVAVEANWKRKDLSVVVFVQASDSGRILGAGVTDLH